MHKTADVELRDLRKSFRDVIAVDGISLCIEQGEFFSLLGPSGCGKTSTLRMIAGFEHPTHGEVLIQGRAMGETAPFERNVNTVFQHYALFPHMSVAENVGFGLRMKHIRRSEVASRVAAALELVRLGEHGNRRPRQLSGGQQQRVALARALINQPAVLLLDEPLGALDLKLRKEMQLELKHLQSQVGITFIYVTHDQEEALTMSDRIAVMSGGRVLQIGSPEEVYERPANRFVAEFIGESNLLEGTVRSVDSGNAVVELDGAFHVPAAVSTNEVTNVGDRVTLGIRPEKVRLTSSGGASGSPLNGRIEQFVYRGSDTDLLVRLPNASVIRARSPQVTDDLFGDSFNIGDTVTVGWATSAARVLPS